LGKAFSGLSGNFSRDLQLSKNGAPEESRQDSDKSARGNYRKIHFDQLKTFAFLIFLRKLD